MKSSCSKNGVEDGVPRWTVCPLRLRIYPLSRGLDARRGRDSAPAGERVAHLHAAAASRLRALFFRRSLPIGYGASARRSNELQATRFAQAQPERRACMGGTGETTVSFQ